MDPQTRSLLAMASRPNFDPNMFPRVRPTAEWNVTQQTEAPMLNRCCGPFFRPPAPSR